MKPPLHQEKLVRRFHRAFNKRHRKLLAKKAKPNERMVRLNQIKPPRNIRLVIDDCGDIVIAAKFIGIKEGEAGIKSNYSSCFLNLRARGTFPRHLTSPCLIKRRERRTK